MKKVLITGINGFFGKYLLKKFSSLGFSVYGMGKKDIETAFADSPNLRPKHYFQGDILDAKLVEEAVSEVSTVIHLAAITQHAKINQDITSALDISYSGTKNILNAMRNNKKCETLIFPSSGKTYGSSINLPLTEAHICRPENYLGKIKLITEQLIDFYQSEDKKYFIFRIFNVYGLEQDKTFLIPTLLSQIAANLKVKNKNISIKLGDIHARRDYIHVEDIAAAFLKVLNCDKKSFIDMPIQHYNLCSGIALSVKEMIECLEVELQRKIIVDVNQNLLRPDEKNIEFGSFALFENNYGWQPQVELLAWLKTVAKDMRKQYE